MTQTTHDAAEGATADLFRGLRELKTTIERQCRNKHDLATAMILACLEEGINTRARIVGTLKELGFHRAHVVMTLETDAGPTPDSGHWMQTSDGVYQLHEQA